ncbi:N-methyltryptophan oxidase [Mycobacterium sp. djl-10]|nr:N-methyltryptophan oxidase [Mycobacterium sp. djl-10]
MSHYDVIVIGAGTWGASVAWQLAERGRTVLALDAFTPPHDHGSHAGATRLARQSNSTGPEYVELTRQAFDAWGAIAERTGTEVMVTTGNVFVGQPGSKWFDNTLRNLESSPFEHQIFSGAEAAARFPRVRIGADELAVWEPNAAVSLVQPAMRAIQQLGRDAGVEVHYGEPVIEWTPNDRGVSVRTGVATYTADRVVVTVGAFSNDVLNLNLPTRVERQVLANFAVDPAAERMPSIYVAAPPGDDSAPAYGCPEPDGTFKFSVPGRGDTLEPAALTQEVTDQDVQRIVSVVRDRLPEIQGDPLSMTVCMWTESEDGHWLLGHHPDSERVIVGAGCNGRGFRYAPVIGNVLADLTEGVQHPALQRFDLSRHHSAAAGN